MRKREFIIDYAEPHSLRDSLAALRSLLYSIGKGVVRVEVMEKRERGSDRQRRWYWPCFVQPFADYLRAQADSAVPISEEAADDAAHGLLKRRYLSYTHYLDGVAHERVGSTKDLSTVEWNKYLDLCADFLRGFGIEVPPPNVVHEPVDRPARVREMRSRVA